MGLAKYNLASNTNNIFIDSIINRNEPIYLIRILNNSLLSLFNINDINLSSFLYVGPVSFFMTNIVIVQFWKNEKINFISLLKIISITLMTSIFSHIFSGINNYSNVLLLYFFITYILLINEMKQTVKPLILSFLFGILLLGMYFINPLTSPIIFGLFITWIFLNFIYKNNYLLENIYILFVFIFAIGSFAFFSEYIINTTNTIFFLLFLLILLICTIFYSFEPIRIKINKINNRISNFNVWIISLILVVSILVILLLVCLPSGFIFNKTLWEINQIFNWSINKTTNFNLWLTINIIYWIVQSSFFVIYLIITISYLRKIKTYDFNSLIGFNNYVIVNNPISIEFWTKYKIGNVSTNILGCSLSFAIFLNWIGTNINKIKQWQIILIGAIVTTLTITLIVLNNLL